MGVVGARFSHQASVPWWLPPVNCVRLGLDFRRKSLRIGPKSTFDIRINH
jgi:hypothetical protein